MKRVGAIVLLLGVLLTGGSVALFGTSALRMNQGRRVETVSLTPGKTAETDLLSVSTKGWCQHTVRVVAEGSAIRDDPMGGEAGKNGKALAYRFPVEITVVGPEGETIHRENTALEWDAGTRSNSSFTRADGTATARVTHHLDKFRPPEAGRMRVRATIRPDEEYGSELKSAELRVYENTARFGGWLIAGFASCCTGPLLAAGGLVLLLVGLGQGKGA